MEILNWVLEAEGFVRELSLGEIEERRM